MSLQENGIEKVRIGMVLDQPFPPDARVEREASTLAANGYEVHLLCLQKNDDEPSEEFYRGFYVHRVNPQRVTVRVPRTKIKTRLSLTGIIKNAYRHLWNIDRPWQVLIDRFVQTYGINVLHIHDLRLVDTGLSVSQKYNIPQVSDLHENYPALMAMMKGKGDADKAARQKHKWELIEDRCVEKSDHILTVVEESRERLINKGGSPELITVLPNVTDIEKLGAVSKTYQMPADLKAKLDNKFVLSYVGYINGEHRGIQTVIDALALLKKDFPNLFFIAAGGYREPYLEKLNAQIQRKVVADQIYFTGWVDETEFPTYIAASDICICPHLENDHTNATFPNKAYLYHLFKKPVIVSGCKPLIRYVENTGGGLWYDSGDADHLADQIVQLYKDHLLREQMGESGYHEVINKYNWAVASQTLLDVYNDLFVDNFALDRV